MDIERGVFLVPWTGLDIKDSVQKLRDIGANFISLSVKDSMGRTWLPSDVVPRWAAGTDVLDKMCDVAHAAGLKVRASVAVFADAAQGQEHPDWVAIGRDGVPARRPGWGEDWYYHLCPGSTGQREHIMRFVAELTARYPVDGIDLDFIRFPWKPGNSDGPEREFCFCPTCVGRFASETGGSLGTQEELPAGWYAWRSRDLTSLVRDISRLTVERGIALAPFIAFWGSGGFGRTELDTAMRRYGQNHGDLATIVTELSPMLYHRFTEEPTCYTSRTVRWIRDMTYQLRLAGARVCSVVQGGPPAAAIEIYDEVRGAVDAGAQSVMSYPGWSWSVDNDYWVALGNVYRQLSMPSS